MITGVHSILYSRDAEKLRSFFRDVLGFSSVDAGHGWLIFALPPAELGIHPSEKEGWQELYLMCDDIEGTLDDLRAKGVEIAEPVKDQGWGLLSAIRIPGGDLLRIYQPRHPTAIAAGPSAD